MARNRFTFLTGDVNWKDYGGKFVSDRRNNGEFDYWLVISVTNMIDACGSDASYTYHVQIEAISPEQVNAEDMRRARESCGDDSTPDSPLAQVEMLSDYGIYAVLWQGTGNNISKLMRAARRETSMIDMLFGFYMDRQENRIGQDGWGLIRGEDIREFLNSR